ncbi:MAG TPA: hypothetical protein VJA40_00025 [archaeon]|nr:hypothetical protein [archaeon]
MLKEPFQGSASRFVFGKGIDTSINPFLPKKTAKHVFREYNNLYHLYPELEFESLDFVYNQDSVNASKFPVVLLTEWMKYVKPKGYLVLKFTENKHLDKKELDRIFKQFLSRYSKVVLESKTGDEWSVVFQKTKSLLVKGDSVDKWTFGVPTIGKRIDWLRAFITSIREQKIPHYEIIIVGTWNDPELMGPDIKYIHFTEKDDKVWVTRKKNIVYENAKYENVFVLHDRFKLDKGWFKGMKRYGNVWDALFFPIIDKNGEEYVHWGVWGKGIERIGYLDIRDWREDYFVGGAFAAMKKRVWEKAKHNEERFWAEQEDAEQQLRVTQAGYVIRATPYSKTHTFIAFPKDAPRYSFDDQKLGRAFEPRGAHWIAPQIMIDVATRVIGLPYLRWRRKISLAIRNRVKRKGYNLIAGTQRD